MNQYNNQNQYGMQPQEHELDWESEIVNDAQEFILLEDGDYNFTVMAVERGRFNGSDKMPACNVAKVKLKIENPDRKYVISYICRKFIRARPYI